MYIMYMSKYSYNIIRGIKKIGIYGKGLEGSSYGECLMHFRYKRLWAFSSSELLWPNIFMKSDLTLKPSLEGGWACLAVAIGWPGLKTPYKLPRNFIVRFCLSKWAYMKEFISCLHALKGQNLGSSNNFFCHPHYAFNRSPPTSALPETPTTKPLFAIAAELKTSF